MIPYLEQKMHIFARKKIVLTIFIKKSFSFKTKKFSKHTDYIFERKNANTCEKNMFLTIFVKKSSFFRWKKNFDGDFFTEKTKNSEK